MSFGIFFVVYFERRFFGFGFVGFGFGFDVCGFGFESGCGCVFGVGFFCFVLGKGRGVGGWVEGWFGLVYFYIGGYDLSFREFIFKGTGFDGGGERVGFLGL